MSKKNYLYGQEWVINKKKFKKNIMNLQSFV